MTLTSGTSGTVTPAPGRARGRGPRRAGRGRRRRRPCRPAAARGPRRRAATSATASSLMRKSQNGVTSSSVPSANRATTASRPELARPSEVQGLRGGPRSARPPPAPGRAGPRRRSRRGRPGTPRSRGRTAAPPVRDLAGGLEQDQAAVRVDDVDAAAQGVAGRGPRSPAPGRGRTGTGAARPCPGTSRGTPRRCSRAGRTGWRRAGRSRPCSSADPSGRRTGSTSSPRRRPGPEPRQEPDRRGNDDSHRPAPVGHFVSSTKVTSSVFPSGSLSFRLASRSRRP